MNLINLKVNNLAYIKVINSNLKLRLMELGFIKGTLIKIIYKSKDYIVVDIRDYKIALNNNICKDIEVI